MPSELQNRESHEDDDRIDQWTYEAQSHQKFVWNVEQGISIYAADQISGSNAHSTPEKHKVVEYVEHVDQYESYQSDIHDDSV